jgi:hypothetical protein
MRVTWAAERFQPTEITLNLTLSRRSGKVDQSQRRATIFTDVSG